VKVGDLVRYKQARQKAAYVPRQGRVGLIVKAEGDSTGWDAYYKVLWDTGATWEHVPDLEVISEVL